MSPTEKGQVSMEFMVYFGILLLIFVGFGPVIFNNNIAIRRRSASIEAGRTATFIEREVNSAVRFGDGYSRNFTLPQEFSRQEYRVEIDYNGEGSLIRVWWGDSVESRRLIATDITGELEPGQNTIKNQDGTIVLE